MGTTDKTRLKETVLASECWEKLPDNKGYLSTFIKMNRVTNEVIYISYHYSRNMYAKNVVIFDTFQEVQQFLMESNN